MTVRPLKSSETGLSVYSCTFGNFKKALNIIPGGSEEFSLLYKPIFLNARFKSVEVSTNQQKNEGKYVEEFLENNYDNGEFSGFNWENERWLAVQIEDNFVVKDRTNRYEDLVYESQEEFFREIEELLPGRYPSIEMAEGCIEIYDRFADDDLGVTSDNYVGLEEMR